MKDERERSIVIEAEGLTDCGKVVIGNSRGVQAVNQLQQAGLYPDAYRLMANLFPIESAMQWALSSQIWSGPLTRLEREVLEFAEQWLKSGSEGIRWAVRTASEAAGLHTGAGCIGMSLFMGSGNIAPAGQSAVSLSPAVWRQVFTAGLIIATTNHSIEHERSLRNALVECGLVLLQNRSNDRVIESV